MLQVIVTIVIALNKVK